MSHDEHAMFITADGHHHSSSTDEHSLAHDALCYAACFAPAGTYPSAVSLSYSKPAVHGPFPKIQLQSGLSLPPGKRPPKPVSIL
ncbi:hypothetical protein GCM10011499_11270 [Pelagibacterium lentulum]|uniref:Uncharacterized protein n=1 Tax=Pelagibacterium lentulum TaxID=2029865 RepID=A0A916RBV9_9HYPH|nr:hypothetical protein GCM10011499_11270 [Pelagibacterium lentulum]